MKTNRNINRTNSYTIDGREYKNFDDLPGYAKDLLKDENQNGVPDLLEGESEGGDTIKSTNTRTIIEVNGKKYNSWDEVPAQYQNLMNMPNANGKSEVIDEPVARPQQFAGEGSNVKSIAVKAVLAIGFGILLYFLLT